MVNLNKFLLKVQELIENIISSKVMMNKNQQLLNLVKEENKITNITVDLKNGEWIKIDSAIYYGRQIYAARNLDGELQWFTTEDGADNFSKKFKKK